MCFFYKKEVKKIKTKFTVLGQPQGKGRPRFVRTATGGRAVTPARTRAYESYISWEYTRQANVYYSARYALKMSIKAFFKVPKSTSKKQKTKMLAGEIRPTKKPDMDNIIKAIADALNGIAYEDDKQIVECCIKKYYTEEERIEVEIENI